MLRWLAVTVAAIMLVLALVSQASSLDTDAEGPASFEVKPTIILPTPETTPEPTTPDEGSPEGVQVGTPSAEESDDDAGEETGE